MCWALTSSENCNACQYGWHCPFNHPNCKSWGDWALYPWRGRHMLLTWKVLALIQLWWEQISQIIFTQAHLAFREFQLSLDIGRGHMYIPVLRGFHAFYYWRWKNLDLNYGRNTVLNLLLCHRWTFNRIKCARSFWAWINLLLAFSSPLMSIKLSANLGGNEWRRCLVSIINPPNPYGWGYQEFPQILPTVYMYWYNFS